MSIFDKWDAEMDNEQFIKDIEEAKENGGNGQFKEVPTGTYEVKVENMEVKESKSEKNAGKPMLYVQFRILQGDYDNQCLFMNQLIDEGWKFDQITKFLDSLDTGVDIFFKNWNQFGNLVADMMETIDGNLEYLLEFKKTKSGFPSYTIKEVYEV